MDVSALSTIRDLTEDWVDATRRPARRLTPWEYLGFACRMHDAAALATLFWPEFLVHEKLVFLREKFSRESFEQFVGAGSSPFDAAAVVNHVHVLDRFAHRPEPDDTEVAEHLAQVLRACWTAKLRDEFGDGVVEVVVDPGLEDRQVVMLQRTLVVARAGSPRGDGGSGRRDSP